QRASYFTNVSYQHAFDPIPARGDLDLAPGTVTDRVLGFAKIDWEPAPHHEFSFHLAAFHERYDNFRVDRLVLDEAQELNRTGGITGHINDRRRAAWGAIEASTGGYYFDSENNPASGDAETPAVVDRETGVISGNAFELFHNRNARWQSQVSVTRYL